MHSCSLLFSSTSVSTVPRRFFARGRLPARHHQPLLHAPFPIGREHFCDRPPRTRTASSTAPLSRIKWNGSFSSRSRLIASRNSSSFDLSGKKQEATVFSKTSREYRIGRLRRRREIEAAHPAEAIAPRKEAHVMGRKADRLRRSGRSFGSASPTSLKQLIAILRRPSLKID